MKVVGQVHFEALEGGTWFLEAEDGARYVLSGADDALRVDGRRAEIEGEIDAQALSFTMAGPLLRVRTFRIL